MLEFSLAKNFNQKTFCKKPFGHSKKDYHMYTVLNYYYILRIF